MVNVGRGLLFFCWSSRLARRSTLNQTGGNIFRPDNLAEGKNALVEGLGGTASAKVFSRCSKIERSNSPALKPCTNSPVLPSPLFRSDSERRPRKRSTMRQRYVVCGVCRFVELVNLVVRLLFSSASNRSRESPTSGPSNASNNLFPPG